MRQPQRIGPYLDIVDARSPEGSFLTVKLGVRDSSFQQVLHHLRATMVAQYYGIIQDGLMDAEHAFKGLNRPLLHEGDKDADDSVIAYSWRPKQDFIWVHDRFHGNAVGKEPPPNRVFVVLVRQETQPSDFGVYGSVEYWSWVAEDPNLPLAPVDHQERYKTRLWSRTL